MPGIVDIPKVKQISGGILGEQSKALQAIRDALEGVKADWPIKVEASGKNSFKVRFIGESGGSGLDVAGAPALFKVCALTGWTLSEDGEWTPMTVSEMVAHPPTELWTDQTDAGNYLRPTWDYVRAYEDA